MKIQAIAVLPEGAEAVAPAAAGKTQVVMLKVSGPTDPNNAVVSRARELVRGAGSPTMVNSFEWALNNNALITEK